MEITPELRNLLRERREANKLTLAGLKEKCGVAISTLSSIESGALTKIKDATFQKIAKHLGLTGADNAPRINDVRVGMGFSLWCAPVFNSLVEDDEHSGSLHFKSLKFSCFFNDQNEQLEPLFLDRFTKQPEIKHHKVYTANELLESLDNDKFDIVFLPEEALFKGKDIVRLGRVMNTVKAGVQLFVIKKKRNGNDLKITNEDEAALKDFLLQKKKGKNVEGEECMFLYPKNSIAQHEVNANLFDKTNYLKEEIVVAELNKFPEQIKSKCDIFFSENKNAKCVVFAGWDILIYKLEQYFETLTAYETNTFDTYKFTDENKPINKYSYDFVTKKQKLDFIKSSIGLQELFDLIEKNIKLLNSLKQSFNNSRYNKIADFVGIEKSFANKRLMQTNFEFLLYPEFVDSLIKVR